MLEVESIEDPVIERHCHLRVIHLPFQQKQLPELGLAVMSVLLLIPQKIVTIEDVLLQEAATV